MKQRLTKPSYTVINDKAITPAANRHELYVQEGTIYYSLSESSRPLVEISIKNIPIIPITTFLIGTLPGKSRARGTR